MAEQNNNTQSSFDGKIIEWPQDQTLKIYHVPADEKQFIRYVASEWYKNQTITNPREQAKTAINNAKILFSQLSAQGYMDD